MNKKIWLFVFQFLLIQTGIINLSSNIVWAQAPVKLLLSSPRHVLDDPYYEEVVHKKGDDAAYEHAKIEYLLVRIRGSRKTFIRNRELHTASEAANHIATKWYRSGGQVKTAQNFIRYIASSSSMTGEPYLVKFRNGNTYPTGKILYNELERLETLVDRKVS